MKAIALIDGQHYLPVTADALNYLTDREQYTIQGLVFIGGMEKIGDKKELEQLNYPVIFEQSALAGIEEAIDRFNPEIVIDLSDEPVVGYRERFQFANFILNKNVIYRGADFQFEPPQLAQIVSKPSFAFIGTGKRIGKTAVTAYSARVLRKDFDPCIVTMSRGGSAEPEVLKGEEIEFTPEYLVKVDAQGRHAASDHFEDAIMSRVTTIGSRRCGGGFAGAPYYSSVVESARVADKLHKDLIIFEGSGSSIPPVQADAYILIIGANQPLDYISSYMGGYRVLLSDLVILTHCEEPMASQEKVAGFRQVLKEINPDLEVVSTIFRPKPLESIEGKRVYYTTTAPESTAGILKNHLEDNYKCQITGLSHNLSRRKALIHDMEEMLNNNNTDIVLTEVKANSIKVAAKMALENGLEVVFCDNVPVCQENRDLYDIIIEMGKLAEKKYK